MRRVHVAALAGGAAAAVSCGGIGTQVFYEPNQDPVTIDARVTDGTVWDFVPGTPGTKQIVDGDVTWTLTWDEDAPPAPIRADLIVMRSARVQMGSIWPKVRSGLYVAPDGHWPLLTPLRVTAVDGDGRPLVVASVADSGSPGVSGRNYLEPAPLDPEGTARWVELTTMFALDALPPAAALQGDWADLTLAADTLAAQPVGNPWGLPPLPPRCGVDVGMERRDDGSIDLWHLYNNYTGDGPFSFSWAQFTENDLDPLWICERLRGIAPVLGTQAIAEAKCGAMHDRIRAALPPIPTPGADLSDYEHERTASALVHGALLRRRLGTWSVTLNKTAEPVADVAGLRAAAEAIRWDSACSQERMEQIIGPIQSASGRAPDWLRVSIAQGYTWPDGDSAFLRIEGDLQPIGPGHWSGDLTGKYMWDGGKSAVVAPSAFASRVDAQIDPAAPDGHTLLVAVVPPVGPSELWNVDGVPTTRHKVRDAQQAYFPDLGKPGGEVRAIQTGSSAAWNFQEGDVSFRQKLHADPLMRYTGVSVAQGKGGFLSVEATPVAAPGAVVPSPDGR